MSLRQRWMELRASSKGMHALEMAESLGVSEGELLSSVCGAAGGEIVATRLEAKWPKFIAELPKLGRVKTVTRNPNAVIEVEGTYDNVEFFGAHMGQSVSDIDLRIFSSRWKWGFAVTEETQRGISRGLQFFDKTGRAIHKVYVRPRTDMAAFDALVAAYRAEDQSDVMAVEPADAPPATKEDAAVDVAALRKDWEAMTDTHEFYHLLRRFEVTRTQALRLAGPDLARPVAKDALTTTLVEVAMTPLAIMIFVGNPGVIQIYSGPIRKVAEMGPWINVLDPGFDLHVRTDRVDSAWVVRKPTTDGVITSLELYSADGEQMAHVVGKRHTGETENPAWRAVAEALV